VLRYEGWTGESLAALGIVACLYTPFAISTLFEHVECALTNGRWDRHTPGMPSDSVPPVFTLAFLGEVPPRLARLVPGLMVFRRRPDGHVAVDDFPDETDVCAAVVARLDPRVVRLERGKLYISMTNGEAVYVPVGESALRGCRRYGRLYVRMTDGG
jgi:hypothetical protein